MKILRFDTDAGEVYLCSARDIDILFIDINVSMLSNHENLGVYKKLALYPSPLAGGPCGPSNLEVNSVR